MIIHLPKQFKVDFGKNAVIYVIVAMGEIVVNALHA